jgi:transcriptional regulator with XRE-family HTH domain
MNDIVSRIKIFLQSMGIANSSFADICGIPRPSLSQLLNGRNKKVSNEVIDKIHAAYPELNMMWLMFGDGDMLRQGAPVPGDGDNAQLAENAFPGSAQTPGERETHVQQSINFDDIDDATAIGYGRRKPATAQRVSSVVESAVNAARNKPAASSSRPNVAKYVTQIMLIFSDGSTQNININN